MIDGIMRQGFPSLEELASTKWVDTLSYLMATSSMMCRDSKDEAIVFINQLGLKFEHAFARVRGNRSSSTPIDWYSMRMILAAQLRAVIEELDGNYDA